MFYKFQAAKASDIFRYDEIFVYIKIGLKFEIFDFLVVYIYIYGSMMDPVLILKMLYKIKLTLAD